MKKKSAPSPSVPKPGVYDEEHKKRDNFLQGISYDLSEEVRLQTHALLDQYLESQRKRKSVERYMVLDILYGIDIPIDIEKLLELLPLHQGSISQASAYNILALLTEAGLVRKLDLLNSSRWFYEKTIGEKPHGYAVCDGCGKIQRLELADIVEPIQEQLPKTFKTNDTLLIVHGLCGRCRRKKIQK